MLEGAASEDPSSREEMKSELIQNKGLLKISIELVRMEEFVRSQLDAMN